MFKARQFSIVESKKRAYLKLRSHCQFVKDRLLSIKAEGNGALPPPDTKASMDTICWASKMAPEVEELQYIRQELILRYGAKCFKPADDYTQGHSVDPAVHTSLGQASSNPSTSVIKQELLHLARIEPSIPLDVAVDLANVIGGSDDSPPPSSGGSDGPGGAGFAAAYPAPPSGGGGALPPLPLPAPIPCDKTDV